MDLPAILVMARRLLPWGVGCLTCLGMWWYLQVPVGQDWDPIAHYLQLELGDADQLAFEPGWLQGAATDLDRLKGLDVLGEPEKAMKNSRTLWVVSRGREAPDGAAEDAYVEVGALRIWRLARDGAPPPDRLSLHLTGASVRQRSEGGEVLTEHRLGRSFRGGLAGGMKVIAVRENAAGQLRGGARLMPAKGRWRELCVQGLRPRKRTVLQAGIPGGLGRGVQLRVGAPGRNEGLMTVSLTPGLSWQEWSLEDLVLPPQGELCVAVRGETTAPVWVEIYTAG